MKTKLSLALIFLAVTFGARAQTAPADRPGVLSIAFEGESWALQIDAPGFVATFDGTKSDGRRYYFGSNQKSGVVLSVTLERTSSPPNLDECRGSMKRRLEQKEDFARNDPVTKELRGMVVLAYTLPEYGGVPVNQRNVFACMPKDGVYIDIHLSKVQYQPSDDQLFTAILDSVGFGSPPAREAQPSAEMMQLLREGTRLYMGSQFREAIVRYQKALDIEKSAHQLGKPLWYVLIDNLGMAYGISGDLKKAKEIFEYGISKDPDYPLFYYNLACTYAEMESIEPAMDYLKKAFERKTHVLAGEKMPDSRSDDSFQRFMKNEQFRKLLDSLMAP